MIGLLLILALTPAQVETEAAAEAGWINVGSDTREGVGPITARHKPLDGVDCLEASVLTDKDPALLKEIILDVAGNVDWSSADLLMSKELVRQPTRIDYVQVLNLPLPMSDRYWFLRGEVREGLDGPGSWSFAWTRIDGAALYPEMHAKTLADYDAPVEVTLNVGSWALVPRGDKTLARFRSCSDSGGSIPRWAGEKAARMMLPNNVVDLIQEAEKRAGG
ncbi:MAG: hypothetical protein H6741_12650 [Alphaproteobacteria bacterium]|nr:hypothetical protein [Alphaproteobacteria bacterium]MCB9793564.1 hypothetical protein [Alphaproteobacteria bacterium]